MKKKDLTLVIFTLLILTSMTESIEAVQWSTNERESIIRPNSVRALMQSPFTRFGQLRLVVKPEAISQVDKLLTQMTRDGTFTGSVLIAQDGVVFLSKGYGLADRAQEIHNTPQTRFHLGSLTKQFTAMAILILESQGKLSVEDPICNYIADCPAAWQDITIHHLLTHTSGLSSELSNQRYWSIETAAIDPALPSDPAYFLGLNPALPMDTSPGEQYAYSNLGYVLLAHIIEQVSGKTYAAFLEQAIFTPLNIRNSGYQDNSSGVALCYPNSTTTTAGQWLPPPISEGAGHLYSTSEDLFAWDQALYTDQLLPRTELERIYEPYVRKTTEYPLFGYGYGWLVGQVLGQPLVGGAGLGPLFSTLYVRYPADGLTLIVLTNQGGINPLSILVAIASNLFAYDLIFVLTAVAFNLLLAALFVAQRKGWTRAVRVIGVLWLLLSVPFGIVFVRYLNNGMGLEIVVPFSFVLLYILVEFLLDYVFKVDFRRKWITHVPYIALEYIALFSLIWIAFSIDRTWGYLVSIAFWILLASLIYLYRDKIKIRQLVTR
jgi:CubicO group peptidase (beta-lactamase class C family)